MNFHLYASNSLKGLSNKLAEMLSNEPGVFQPRYIITQTDGMNNWLKIQLAEQMGISAHCRFLKPNDIINQVYTVLGGEISTALATESMAWVYYKLLGKQAFADAFPHIAAYFGE